jgi:hypothetical protein
MLELTVPAIISAILGWLSPWTLERLKGTFLGGAKTITLITGLIGTGLAFIVNFALVELKLVEVDLPIETLVLIGFGIYQTAASISYHTLPKYIKK